jgi:hypothetical protein
VTEVVGVPRPRSCLFCRRRVIGQRRRSTRIRCCRGWPSGRGNLTFFSAPMLSNLRDCVVGITASPKIARHYNTLQGRRLHENEADYRSCRRRFSFARLHLLADPSRASAGAVEVGFWYSVCNSTSAVSLLRPEVCQAGIVLDSHALTSDRTVP